MTEENKIQIHLGPKEAVWAEKVEGNRARIVQVSLTSSYNLGDVVDLLPAGEDGLPVAGAVRERQFGCKTALLYEQPHEETWEALVSVLLDKGCEAAVLTLGLCLVAHNEEDDPIAFATEAGLFVELFEGYHQELLHVTEAVHGD